MGRLDDITLEELYELKDQIDEGKPRERVLAAIGRRKGDQLDTLADRHGVVEKTIRNWLDRFEKEPIEQAPYDAPRPGGPAKIEGQDREQLFEQLQQPPTELGYDQQACPVGRPSCVRSPREHVLAASLRRSGPLARRVLRA